MPNATMSKDGERRFTLKVSARVGLEDLALLVAYEVYGRAGFPNGAYPDDIDPEHWKAFTSKRGLLKHAREELKHSGYIAFTRASDNLPYGSDDRYDAWMEAGREVVRDLFPELAEQNNT